MKIAAFTTLLLAASLHLHADTPPAPPPTNEILAIVNDEPLTTVDLISDPQYSQDFPKSPGSGTDAQRLHAYNQGVARLIDRKLIVQEFHREGYAFSSDEIEGYVTSIIKTEYGGNERLLRAFLATNGLTMDDLRQHVEEDVIVRFMTKRNIDQKMPPAPGGPVSAPADAAAQRKALRDSWYTSLRAKADIEFFEGSWNPSAPPIEE